MKAWEKNIRKVTPYVPGEQPKEQNIIKLNTNENPYPPSPYVDKILRDFDVNKLRLYPDPTCQVLVDAIAKRYGKSPKQVFVGVGSDDVLAMCYLTFFNSENPILFPDITYSFYDVWADEFRVPYEQIPLDENLHIVPDDYKHVNGGIIFPNPNAPTGVLMPLAQIEEIVQANPDVIVIVDEAYIDFGGESAIPLTEKYDNLLVVQTFSKSRSMAGSRIGFAIGNEKLIQYLNDVKYSFNSYTMDVLTLALGKEAIEDEDYFQMNCHSIMLTREWAKDCMRDMGFLFEDSMANFLFVTHPKYAAQEIFEYLKSKGIYVRYFSKPERISNYLRITIGTREDMKALFEAIQQFMVQA